MIENPTPQQVEWLLRPCPTCGAVPAEACFKPRKPGAPFRKTYLSVLHERRMAEPRRVRRRPSI